MITLSDTCECLHWWPGRPIIATSHAIERSEQRDVPIPSHLPMVQSVERVEHDAFELHLTIEGIPVAYIAQPYFRDGEFAVVVATVYFYSTRRNNRLTHRQRKRRERSQQPSRSRWNRRSRLNNTDA